ncbi:MAG: ORF6N domain-containing protein [Bacteroides sp.]|uniref:ORF6N domain-containing protein n=2 Tax=Bacteroides sp. TaxID=29523 RepID=UPI002FCCAAD2
MMELQRIQNKIYEIRGQKVMLDFDLAEMYQVETRVLNQAVKRNIKRFPPDFMFQLTTDEWEILKSQFVISSWGGTRKLPFAFTEQGLAMLSGVLNSDIAIQVNINIMRAFVAVRQLIANPPVDRVGQLESQMQELRNYMEEVFADYNDINDDTRMQLELINQTLAELQANNMKRDTSRKPIGFKNYNQ